MFKDDLSKKRYTHERWVIYWYHNRKMIEFPLKDKGESEAEDLRMKASLAL